MTSPDIRAARQALGLSLQGLARALGMTQRQTIRRYEDGTRIPSGLYLTALALLLEREGLEPSHYGLSAPRRAA